MYAIEVYERIPLKLKYSKRWHKGKHATTNIKIEVDDDEICGENNRELTQDQLPLLLQLLPKFSI